MLPPSAASSRGSAPGRPRVAFLAAYMNNEYEWSIWRGVRAAVEERGGSVVGFAGSSIGNPDAEHHARCVVFDLIDRASFDGILCVSSVVGHYAGVTKTEAWLERWRLPVSSIGPAERIPTVLIEDGAGISELMAHLISHHQLRRIAFIQGTPSNSEAKRRLAAYVAALDSHGLSYDPKLVLSGDFTAPSGVRAIEELFDINQVRASEVDAIVAANDYMACGAMEELARRRISVPEQLAVVGFDDIAKARVFNPPLTTVRQTLELLGRKGAHRLLDQLDGKAVAGAVTVPTELVLRRSCGCVPTEGIRRQSAFEGGDAPRDSLHAVSGSTVLAALSAELQGSAGNFARALEPLLREVVAEGGGELGEGRRLADELATRVRLAREDLIHEQLTRLARILHTRMFGPQVELSTALAEHLPAFGIHECAVSELMAPDATFPFGRLKLAFGFDRRTLEPKIATFDARLLVPPAFAELTTSSALVMPLTCGAESLGVAVIPASPRDGKFYETLGEMFATILKVLDLRRRIPRVA
jgi:DNA-binding LacI/PurR family transcriptional regulator